MQQLYQTNHWILCRADFEADVVKIFFVHEQRIVAEYLSRILITHAIHFAARLGETQTAHYPRYHDNRDNDRNDKDNRNRNRNFLFYAHKKLNLILLQHVQITITGSI